MYDPAVNPVTVYGNVTAFAFPEVVPVHVTFPEPVPVIWIDPVVVAQTFGLLTVPSAITDVALTVIVT